MADMGPTGIGAFHNPIIKRGDTTVNVINPVSDWIDISVAGDNEINLLVGDFGIPTIAFAVTVASGGTYSIDWGDGTVDTARASTTTYQHTYTVGSGTACSLGYTTFAITIYNASANITRFEMKAHNISTQDQMASLLMAVFGTTNLTTLASAFNSTSVACYSLQSVVFPASLNSVTSMDHCFRGCFSLQYVTMPTSMSSLATMAGVFQQCSTLTALSLPSSLNSLTDISSAFDSCFALKNITMPTSMTALLSINSCFTNCYSLNSVTLPNLLTVTNFSQMFYGAYSIQTITNFDNLGSTSSNVNGYFALTWAEQITQSISLACKLTSFYANGASGKKNKVTSIRLTNVNSPFSSSSSPQINIAYTSLDATAIETLFDDIPTGLSSKTISIQGATGNVGLISKASSGTTSGSTTITMSNTSSLATGMEVYGTGVTTAVAVTMQDAGDTVTRTAHGLADGMKVSFDTIVSTTGITIHTPYFVVGRTDDTFQVSLTSGGSPIALTTDGSGTLLYVPTIVTINANTNIIIDVPCSATGTVTVTAQTLKRSKALLKGWTITN